MDRDRDFYGGPPDDYGGRGPGGNPGGPASRGRGPSAGDSPEYPGGGGRRMSRGISPDDNGAPLSKVMFIKRMIDEDLPEQEIDRRCASAPEGPACVRLCRLPAAGSALAPSTAAVQSCPPCPQEQPIHVRCGCHAWPWASDSASAGLPLQHTWLHLVTPMLVAILCPYHTQPSCVFQFTTAHIPHSHKAGASHWLAMPESDRTSRTATSARSIQRS